MNWKIIPILILISSAFFCRAVFAYDDKTTHPALTSEAINFYNLNFSQKISDEEKEWIISGSILEDTPPRWVNHFYDPIYKTGWTGEQGGLNPQDILRQFTDLFLSNDSAVSALNWVHNQELQAKYKLYYGNQTWEKAIYEYVKNKNKKEAYSALGYVLHLLEDMAVPDHTRNDTHPNDSPYENYSTRFTRDSWQIADKLQNEKPVIFNSLDEYFEYLANYSNNYFFSKDTINDSKYNKPKIIYDDGNYAYGLNKDKKEFRLARIEIKIQNGQPKINYFLDEKEKNILETYFSYLSREAVLSGAGVIDLFFKEAEKTEKDPSLLKIPPENKSAIISIVGEFFKISNFLKNTAVGVANTLGDTWNKLAGNEPAAVVQSVSSLQNNPVPDILTSQVQMPRQPATLTPPSVSSPTPSFNPPPPDNPTPVKPGFTAPPLPPPFTPSLPWPGFGGGSNPAEVAPPPSPSTPSDTTPPNPPVIISPADFSQTFTSANIVFSGTAEASSIISNDFNTSTTTADSSGNWTLSFSLNQSTTTIKFFARDTAENISNSTEISLFIDSIAPSINSFSISECNQSFSSDGCLVSNTTLHLFWQTTAEDLDYFELTHSTSSGQVQTSTTTATSTSVVITDNSVNNFSVRAKDKTGNWSNASTTTAEISSIPVVINEVAWAGTIDYPEDEWIELYNRTSKEINLNNWVLFSQTDNTPYLNLSGTISSKGYYLIERKNTGEENEMTESSVKDIPANLWASFSYGLKDTGDVLVLSHASTTIDQTPSGSWAGGDLAIRRTMERFSPDLSGNDSANWGTNNTIIKNGQNADSQPINGTPKARNSANYLIAKGSPWISSNITLTKTNSPYFVGDPYGSALQVFQNNSVLTIEPGVVIKFYNDAGFSFVGNAKIIAQGAAGDDKRIVFTSFSDDTYGGDLDATSTAPIPGSWYGVEVQANGSIFDYAIFRYGGDWYSGVGNHGANLSVKNASAAITNSIFEYSKVYGLKLVNSNSTVSNNTFRFNNNSEEAASTGLYSEYGASTIQTNTFSNNRRGLSLAISQAVVEGNTFNSNTIEAVYSAGPMGNFSNNSGSGNGANAIVLAAGDITSQNSTSTMRANSLFYILENSVNVVAGSGLVVEPGAIVKGSPFSASLNVFGNLLVNGSSISDIIFTANAEPVFPKKDYWQGIKMWPGSHSIIKGATFSYADKAISYYNSPIKLEKVRFENNNWAVYADPVPSSISALMVEIENLGNLATTSPSGLW